MLCPPENKGRGGVRVGVLPIKDKRGGSKTGGESLGHDADLTKPLLLTQGITEQILHFGGVLC